jgi:CubicO group peptidase (beta-lactamase class C family)
MMLKTTIAPSIRLFLGGAALSLSACSTMTAPAVSLPAPDLSKPFAIADMQSATILDVEVYRPSQTLPSCHSDPLPHSQADARLKPALDQVVSYSGEAQGVGLLILKDGAVVASDFTEGVDSATPFVSASMMKSVLAVLVGNAIEDGLIGSADDRIGDYLPEWSDDPRGDITLRQLLTMSSGLEPVSFMAFLTADDANALVRTMAAADKPDRAFYYSNSVSQLVASIMDRQTRDAGRGGLAQYLHDEIWCPLGNGEARWWTDNRGMPRGYAGLHAGLADWARIGELIRLQGRVDGEQIVPSEWIAEMAKPSASNDQYGLHLWRAGTWTERRPYNADNPIKIYHSAPFLAEDTVYFDGFGGQRVYVIPSLGLTIARAGHVNMEFDDAAIPNLLAEALN